MHKKTAIFGVDLFGDEVLNKEQIVACIDKIWHHNKVYIMLHGNEEQSNEWINKNSKIIKKYEKHKKLFIIKWSDLQSTQRYLDYYNNVFLQEYNKEDSGQDLRNAIDETVNAFLLRHPEKPKEETKVFVLEEMAFLMKFAKEEKPDYFIYPSKALPAFEESKKYFLQGEKDLEWMEIVIYDNEEKPKENNKKNITQTREDSTIIKDKISFFCEHLLYFNKQANAINRALKEFNTTLNYITLYSDFLTEKTLSEALKDLQCQYTYLNETLGELSDKNEVVMCSFEQKNQSNPLQNDKSTFSFKF